MRILSGMQPTSHLHLGNYLGALRNWVKLQDEPNSECYYMVADLHAVTQDYAADGLADATREIAAAFIAGGVDPAKSSIFVQSSVAAHSELMWLLSTMTQMGKLERMTQFKDKAGKNAERAGLGLFAYPVLMAADILIYKATHVPVGEDQKQHLELSRDVAATFNTKYKCETLIQPEPYIVGDATRVMSLQDGTKKMSKSDPSEKSRINMTDGADTIAKKIKKAQTDPEALPETVKELEGRAGALNLVTIYAALAEISKDDVLNRYAGKMWGEFKPALADLAVEKLAPMTERMNQLMADPLEIDNILKAGSEKANEITQQTLKEVRDTMGFWK